MAKRSLISTGVSVGVEKNQNDKEKLPVRWWVDKNETRILEEGVRVVLKYHPDLGKDKENRSRMFEFSNEELEAIRLKNQPNNVFDKIGLIRALSRTAQDKIMADVNKRAFDCYHENGLDKTVELFEMDPRINYLLRGFALYEAKLIKINASALIY